MHDVIIVGGSYAGLSAAMQLARARRDVVVVDAGQRRNRFAASSHGFLGRDGAEPGAIVAEGRGQLLAYPTVRLVEGEVVSAAGAIDGFRVGLADGTAIAGRRIVIASGVTDVLPDIPGLAAQWGTGAMTCPYCHGYELDRGRIGVLATGPIALHQAAMLPEWGETTLFANGLLDLSSPEIAGLRARGVAIEAAPVEAVEGEPGAPVVRLADGRRAAVDGLFIAPQIRINGPVADMLGCALSDGPQGPHITADPVRQTSVPGVFACGDVARPMASVALAVADGALAGTSAHRTLIFPELSRAA